ncbi:unnamed protein product [Musa acuminata subsp. burmannicoides]
MDSVEEGKEYHHHNSSSSSSCNNNDRGARAVVKGKRTKRRRVHLPPASALAGPATSSASSAEFSSSITEEDEDMANCLVLLSRGRNVDPKPESAAEEGIDRGGGTEKCTSLGSAEAAVATTDAKAGACVYECKTCYKCFPSFQALGGHRASHKKPRMMVPAAAEDDGLQINVNSFSKPLVAPNDGNSISGGSNKLRVHECSICGSEFSSGQALGGHMRRHRPLLTTKESPELKKESFVLSLDLNLPAPSDGDHEELPILPPAMTAFPFEGEQPLVFSASPLVDCHY